MFRLGQILRNSFLRLEGWFGVLSKGLFGLVNNFFGFFAQRFGFTQSQYFLEDDEAQSIKKMAPKQPISTPKNPTADTSTAIRRRPNTKKIDDYYINMARDLKKP